MKITVHGFDMYGQPISETIEVAAPQPKRPTRDFLARWVFVGPLWNLGHRLGFHSFRRIKSIKAKR